MDKRSARTGRVIIHSTCLSGGHSDVDPPDPIPNSEVKHVSADGSVGLPHVRVGHCQAFIPKKSVSRWGYALFFVWDFGY